MPRRQTELSRRSFLHTGAAAVCALAIPSRSAQAATTAVDRFRHWTLDNGLEVVLIADRRLPLATHSLWYKVGAGDEPIGKTGLAHFFEHAMFKGTKKFPGDTFKRFVNRFGGSQNAITFVDSTVFFQAMPSAHLGQLMAMEADRMNGLDLSPEQVKLELNAVLEEKRGQETQDATLYNQALMRARFQGHRLAEPGIGTKEDLQRLSYDDLMGFYRSNYVPNNAVLVVATDTPEDELRKLAEQTYGKVPRSTSFVPRNRPPVRETPAQPRVEFESAQTNAAVVTRVYTLPGSAKLPARDVVALQMFAQLANDLSYKSGVWTELVQNRKIASSAGASFARFLSYSDCTIYVQANPGVSVEAAEQALTETIIRMRADPPGKASFEALRTRTQVELVTSSELQSTDVQGIGNLLTKDLSVDDYSSFEREIKAVTLDDLVRATTTYLDDSKFITGVFKPKA